MSGTEPCGVCPINILDGKEGCKEGKVLFEERGVRPEGMDNIPLGGVQLGRVGLGLYTHKLIKGRQMAAEG